MAQVMTFAQAPRWAQYSSTFHEGETFLVLSDSSHEVIEVTRNLAGAIGALDYDTNLGYDDRGNEHWIGVTCE